MNATRIEPLDLERVILREIDNKRMTRNDVAQTYAILLKFPGDYNWQRINGAIIKRWSKYALEYIKRRAWAIVKMGVIA